jgi:hypothetical protein
VLPEVKEELMHRIQRCLSALLLGVVLIAPLGMQASFNPVDDKHHDRDDKRAKRYYDREHKDWHDWDDRENAAYRHWLMQERREQQYRDYARLRREQQIEYWRWRHEHPDWH